MKYYLIAGEASGDLHGSNLMKELKTQDPQADFRYWGGNLMKAVGGTLVKHYRDHALMGTWEVIKKLGSIRENFRICKEDIIQYHPDVVVLIDYGGFNLRMARYAKENGFHVHYYITPKIWAWRKGRVKKIKKYVDRSFVILPFEEDFFKKFHCQVDYVGNPLMDAVEKKIQEPSNRPEFIVSNGLNLQKPIIALLAGSRKQEIDMCLPEMIKAVQPFSDFQLVIAGAISMDKDYYNKFIEGTEVKMVYNKTYDLLKYAHTAVVVSGTATLETALFEVPQVVVYKTSMFTYVLGRPFVWIKYFSLVNLIMGQGIVKELLQFNLSKKISKELYSLLYDETYRNEMFHNYKTLKLKVGTSGCSSEVARLMLSYLKNA
jgi:lipid-A-disaccharide synthase